MATRTVNKIATVKNAAQVAAKQVKSNIKKGRPITDEYVMSNTAKQRTADLNKSNSASKTAGRAKNVESKLKKAESKKTAPKAVKFTRVGGVISVPKKLKKTIY